MKNLRWVSLFLMVALAACSIAHKTATTPPKPDKVTADGAYLIHETVKGETLQSLSKKYGISVEEILTMNPKLSHEPKEEIPLGKKLTIVIVKKK